MASYFEARVGQIPVAFIFGFYLFFVANRFWSQSNLVGNPTKVAMLLNVGLRGVDEGARLMRRTIVRYLCLGHVLTMSSISAPVRKRFPTVRHIVDSGFMNENEMAVFENLATQHNKFFVPFVWATMLVSQARNEGRIKYDVVVSQIVKDINYYRSSCEMLFTYDYIAIPLIYTQVATFGVFFWLLVTLFSRQYMGDLQLRGDYYFPVFTFMQFIFYMGSLKVAEQMLSPFGEDDDDVDLNSGIDGLLNGAYQIVDELHDIQPELEKDMYWGVAQFQIPYTAAAQQYQKETPQGTAERIMVPAKKTQFVITEPVKKSA